MHCSNRSLKVTFHLLLICKHPNMAVFWGEQNFGELCCQKGFAMFNLDENYQFVMAQHPADMRTGVNKL